MIVQEDITVAKGIAIWLGPISTAEAIDGYVDLSGDSRKVPAFARMGDPVLSRRDLTNVRLLQ